MRDWKIVKTIDLLKAAREGKAEGKMYALKSWALPYCIYYVKESEFPAHTATAKALFKKQDSKVTIETHWQLYKFDINRKGKVQTGYEVQQDANAEWYAIDAKDWEEFEHEKWEEWERSVLQQELNKRTQAEPVADIFKPCNKRGILPIPPFVHSLPPNYDLPSTLSEKDRENLKGIWELKPKSTYSSRFDLEILLDNLMKDRSPIRFLYMPPQIKKQIDDMLKEK